jgi:hypothetical protein
VLAGKTADAAVAGVADAAKVVGVAPPKLSIAAAVVDADRRARQGMHAAQTLGALFGDV